MALCPVNVGKVMFKQRLIVFVLLASLLYACHTAPVIGKSSHQQSTSSSQEVGVKQQKFGASKSTSSAETEVIQPELLLLNIQQTNLTDTCELDQDHKDMCELCTRYVDDPQVVYFGCCKNYDKMFDFCKEFLNYTYKEE